MSTSPGISEVEEDTNRLRNLPTQTSVADNILVVNSQDPSRKSHFSTISRESSQLAKLPSRAWNHFRRSEEIAPEDQEITQATDFVMENERGILLFGYPLYSSDSLLPFDPSAWVSSDGSSISSLDEFLLPDLTWEWTWRRWYVDMSGEVDDQGWSYSFRFGSYHWYSRHHFFNAFVRRRRWKRMRQKVCDFDALTEVGTRTLRPAFDVRTANRPSEPEPTPSGIPPLIEEDTSGGLSILERSLKNARIDRERIACVKEFTAAASNYHIMEHYNPAIAPFPLKMIAELLEFPDSKKLLLRFLKHYRSKQQRHEFPFIDLLIVEVQESIDTKYEAKDETEIKLDELKEKLNLKEKQKVFIT